MLVSDRQVVALTVVCLVVIHCGCNESTSPTNAASLPVATPSDVTTNPDTPWAPTDRRRVIEDIAAAERESHERETPRPVIQLTTPPGWSKSEPRPLPTEENGFTVAFDHESGLAVTLYQFTRGERSIPQDVSAPVVQREMDLARNGIREAVDLGVWQGARELKSETVMLGDSRQPALWSQYELSVNEITVLSDIYVWTHGNAFLKLRCTSHSSDFDSNQAVLRPLLTAFGSLPATAE